MKINLVEWMTLLVIFFLAGAIIGFYDDWIWWLPLSLFGTSVICGIIGGIANEQEKKKFYK